ncbi:MAG TPA: DUF4434 domain-containing protein [Longimicrobium sp.]|nr:DUF4434 domain-containing protein [Longimicrobium sp.]
MRILLCAILSLGATTCGNHLPAARASQSAAVAKPCSAWTAPRAPEHPADSIRAVFMALDDRLDTSISQQRAFFDTFRMNAVVVHSIVGYRSLHSSRTANRVRQAAYLLHNRPPGTAVYIGLAYAEKFNSDELSPADVQLAIDQDLAAAAELRRVAGTDTSRIAGWYLSREIHNFNLVPPARQTEQVKRIRAYLEGVAGALHPRGKVLISPYFVPKVRPRESELLGPAATGALFAQLVRRTGVTDVLLQDGVGVRNSPDHQLECRWPDAADYIPIAARYAEAVSRSLPDSVTFWSNLEGFVQDSDRPVDVQRRFAQQLSVVPAGRPLVMYDAAQCKAVGVCATRPRP